jgi:hypothetical protein
LPSRAQPGDVDAFFATYPNTTEALAQAVRHLIFDIVKGAEETLDQSARVVGYSFGRGYRNTVCAIIPSQKGVKLGLANGASLPDPRGLLEGEGKVHRHIKFKSLADVKRAGVKAMLKSCYAAWKARGEECDLRPAKIRESART